MYLIITSPQELQLNNDLALIGKPPLTTITISSVLRRIEYSDFRDQFLSHYVPYTIVDMEPTSVAILKDMDPLFVTEGVIGEMFMTGSGQHDHDANYSPISHDHNTNYSPLNHNHDAAYAPLSHVNDMNLHANTVLAPFTFTMEGNGAVGVWLTAATRSGIPSHLAPAISPADVILIASTYSNETDNSHFSVDFYVNGAGSPAYTWDIVNARYGYKTLDDTANPPDLFLNQGDRLSLRIGSITNAPKDAFIVLYFALVSDPLPTEVFAATI